MTSHEAIDVRISCRAYTNEPLDQHTLDELRGFVSEMCEESGLRFVLVGPDEGGSGLKLSGRMFTGNVSSYLALIGPDENDTRERFGYFGEKFVLHATCLGLGTCWVAGTFDRASVSVPLGEGEVIHDVIPVGHVPAKQPFAQRTIRTGLRRRDKKPKRSTRVPPRSLRHPLGSALVSGASSRGPLRSTSSRSSSCRTRRGCVPPFPTSSGRWPIPTSASRSCTSS